MLLAHMCRLLSFGLLYRQQSHLLGRMPTTLEALWGMPGLCLSLIAANCLPDKLLLLCTWAECLGPACR